MTLDAARVMERTVPSTTSSGCYPSSPDLHRNNTTLPTGAPCPLPHCAGSPVDMPTATYPSECEQCVKECDVPNCDLSTEEQCTDRCVVVPCDDPCLDVCGSSCAPWPATLCEEAQCGFEELLGCCPDLSYQGHVYLNLPSHTSNHSQSQQLDWNSAGLSGELDALICACDSRSIPHSFDCNACNPKPLRTDKSHHSYDPPASMPASTPTPESPASALFSSMLSSSPSVRSSPEPLSNQQIGQPAGSFDCTPEMRITSRHERSMEPVFCLWGNCGKPFNSFGELILHVNNDHLRLPISQGSLQPSPYVVSNLQSAFPARGTLQGHSAFTDINTMSCLWGNCNVYPTPSHVPGPSTGNVTDAALELLASHLLKDHFGIPVSPPSTSNHDVSGTLLPKRDLVPPDRSPTMPSAPADAPPIPDDSPMLTPVVDPVHSTPAPDISPQHHCKWQLCPDAQTDFTSSAALTTHITDVHVGGGKARYHCLWEGCNRHGESGFASKQKILRHVQSHTGHRPFRCKVCEQYFSEAATLQQHMRRHTKEKPYICDFPGCNKAFAITGALTIHKRVHNGHKPFKCTYCDRSFSESSNLSKHIRTHTGDRPYACPHPGCDKRFARPDQVARHMNVHKKKADTADDAAEAVGDADADGMDVKMEA